MQKSLFRNILLTVFSDSIFWQDLPDSKSEIFAKGEIFGGGILVQVSNHSFLFV
jgi:hypothetical protein